MLTEAPRSHFREEQVKEVAEIFKDRNDHSGIFSDPFGLYFRSLMVFSSLVFFIKLKMRILLEVKEIQRRKIMKMTSLLNLKVHI